MEMSHVPSGSYHKQQASVVPEFAPHRLSSTNTEPHINTVTDRQLTTALVTSHTYGITGEQTQARDIVILMLTAAET